MKTVSSHLNIQSTNPARNLIHSVCLYCPKYLKPSEYVRQRQNSKKNFINWPSYSLRSLDYAKCDYMYFTLICDLLQTTQRNEQRILLYLSTQIRFPIGVGRVTCRGLKLANSLGRPKLTRACFKRRATAVPNSNEFGSAAVSNV